MTQRDARLFLALVALPALWLLGPLFAGRTHFLGDVMRSFQPWLTYAAQELQSGRMPLWNPYAACGEPLLANPQLMTFFPPAQLFWLFPFASAGRFFLLLCEALFVGGLFSLYRRHGRGGAALGAAAVAWGGFTLIHWEFTAAMATLPCIALFLLFAARRAWAGLAAATALLFFAGYTQFAVYALMAGGLLALGAGIREKRLQPAAAFGMAVGAGLILALPQILASWEAASLSLRETAGPGDARRHLLSPVFLLKFFIPALHDKVASPYGPRIFDHTLWPIQWNWLTTFYAGAVIPALAMAGAWAGRKQASARLWMAVAFLGFLLAFGVEPFFGLLRAAVPGLRYMTHFSNAMILVLIGLGGLAAAGASKGDRRILVGVLGAGAAFSMLMALSPALRSATAERMLGVAPLTAAQQVWMARAAGHAAALSVIGAGICFLGRGRVTALILFTLADLCWFGRDLQPTVSDGFYRAPLPLAGRLQPDDGRYAIDPQMIRDDARPLDGSTAETGYQSLRQLLIPNMQLPFRVHQAWSHDVFPFRPFAEFRRLISVDRPLGPALDFLGARHILTLRALPAPAVYKAERPNGLLYGNAGGLSRVTRVGRAVTWAGKEERLRGLAGPWRPGEEVVLEGAFSYLPMETGEWRWNDVRPGALRAEGTAGGGWLVWSQIDYPGWEAYVNGRKTDIRRANHAFQALALPAGAWTADILYRPTPLFGALALAALWAAVLTALGLRRLRRFAGG